jgi:hypothetical protein
MAIVSLSCSEGLTSVVKEPYEDSAGTAGASAIIPGGINDRFTRKASLTPNGEQI